MSGFRDERQRALACMALLVGAGMRGYWNSEGPLDKAVKHKVESPLGGGEQTVLQVAWDVWNGSGRTKVADIINTLDQRNLDAVGGLLRCMSAGPEAIDGWIRVQRVSP